MPDFLLIHSGFNEQKKYLKGYFVFLLTIHIGKCTVTVKRIS